MMTGKQVYSSLISLMFLITCNDCQIPDDYPNEYPEGFPNEGGNGNFDPRDQMGPAGMNHPFFNPEALLANSKFAEQFGHLKPEVAKKRLQYIVEKMDKNRDGIVNKKELTAWVLRSFHLMSEKEANERFEQTDKNKDGYVTWLEHAKDMFSSTVNTGFMPEDQKFPEDEKMVREDREMFLASDLNSDGMLDQKEYQSYSHPEDFDHTMEIMYRRVMEEKDFNKDGFLSFQEFIHPEGQEKDEKWHEEEKVRFAKYFDKSGDGKMDKEEVILWQQPNNWDTAEMEAENLIKTSDDNKDGKLSMKEILKHHDTFVGSEVTDFGDHLKAPQKFYDEL